MKFDYIVVGAGSAGAVVAARLSEEPAVSVLLIEAGDNGRHLNVQVPAAFPKQFNTKHDWNYTTEPEPWLDNRAIYHPRGKMLGGSSGQNAMIYIRGNRADYDGWAANGATGWSYDDVLPYFKKSEKNSRGASTFHGDDGPLYIEDPRDPNPLSQAFVDAMVASGLPANDDFNGADQVGAGHYQVTQHRGRRWNTADGYVTPARKRPNFTVWTDTLVHRVTIEGGRATGVVVERNGSVETVKAGAEVVLSAGAFGSPHLLMLSGVGPADHLREHGVDVVVDNPNVGAHLMDHPMYMLNFETTAKGTLFDAEKPSQLVKYLARRKGLLTSNIAEAGGFFHTRSGDAAPYMQFIAAPGYFWDNGFDSHPSPAYALGLSMVGAASTGEVRLKNSDPSNQASVKFNYFSDPADMDAMVTAIERARDVAASGPLAGVTGKEIKPGSDAKSRGELEASIRKGVQHTYHPACTARMGTEADGVVDWELRVHGISGLRVADASVFPVIPHGNTHAPTVLVGEKAADLIKESR